jgi:LPS sulfotransferase NodH
MEAWLEHLGDISMRVSYEDLVAGPKATLTKVAKLCGLPKPKGKLPDVGDDRGCAKAYLDFLNEARS